MNLLQLAQKSLVLRDFLQPRLLGELKHAHRVVVGPVPQLRVEMPKETGARPAPKSTTD